MASVSVIKLKVRRGTDAQRKQITLDEGELGFVTDPGKQRLFVGDGRTAGGISATMKFYAGSITSTPSAFATAQPNDLIYNTGDSKLYVLTGADFTAFSSYRYIGPAVDGVTIQTNESNAYYAVLGGMNALSGTAVPTFSGSSSVKGTLWVDPAANYVLKVIQ
jgi:hypothetical protein